MTDKWLNQFATQEALSMTSIRTRHSDGVPTICAVRVLL